MIEALRFDHVSIKENEYMQLRDFNLCIFEGEVHGVIGDYGIHHGQLLRLLSCTVVPQGGRMYLYDREISAFSYGEAKDHGIYTITENGCLLEKMTILENIFVSAHSYFGWYFSKPGITGKAREYFSFFDLPLALDTPIDSLSILEKCAVVIVGALIAGARIFILDEVTSLLSEQEHRIFRRILSCLKFMGITVICLVNRVDELVSFTDRATLVKNGSTVRSLEKADYSYDKMIATLLV